MTELWSFFPFNMQVPSQIGATPIMTPQPMIYTQTGLRPTNPFAPISGTQVSAPKASGPNLKVLLDPGPLLEDHMVAMARSSYDQFGLHLPTITLRRPWLPVGFNASNSLYVGMPSHNMKTAGGAECCILSTDSCK